MIHIIFITALLLLNMLVYVVGEGLFIIIIGDLISIITWLFINTTYRNS